MSLENDDEFTYQRDDITSVLGKEIQVYMNSIGQVITEYLVHFDMFKDIMKEYGFHLVKPKLHGINSGLFNKDKFTIEDGLGSFSTILDELPQLSSKDPLLSNKNKALKAKRGPYFEANQLYTTLNISKDEIQRNELLKQLSSLNNWFIFQKI